MKALIEALGLPEAEANAVSEELGYRQASTLFPLDRYPNYYYTVEDLQEYVETVAWPRFVLNNLGELVATNRTAQALWKIDFQAERQHRTPAQLNLLSIANEKKFAEHFVNWDECVATLIGVLKGKPDHPGSLTNPDAYLQQVLVEFVKHDTGYIQRLINLWLTTPAREAKSHWSYDVTWDQPGIGEMRFRCLVSTVNEHDALGLNDWIPLDAECWLDLEHFKDARPPGDGTRA